MKRIFTIFLMTASISVFSQQLSPEIIATAGDHFENENISLSWTIGEPVISTLSGEYILTQGFHQDMYIITAIDEVEFLTFDINVFPNPTTDYLNIEIKQILENQQKVSIQLLDSKGSLLNEHTYSDLSISMRINLQTYERANYFLRIIVNDQIKSYKILKI